MDSGSRGSLQQIILDEISLEGLEGVTLPSLWIYLSKPLNVTLTEELKEQIWSFIKGVHKNLQFFELPEERDNVKLFDRYHFVDPDLGVPLSTDECPFVRYKCVPITDGNILGSCQWYKERKPIQFDLVKDLNVGAVTKIWGNKFIIVASQELRYKALTPENVPRPKDLTVIQYCIWEAIGRSRFNGETTSGTWSLTHYCKDSTIVFYIKNKLIRNGVVCHQMYNEKRSDRLTVTSLLTLPRFYPTNRSTLVSMVEKLFLILKEQPENKMTLLEARTHFPSFERQKSFKKAMLTHFFRQIFETQSVPYYEIYPNSKSKSTSSSFRTVTMVSLRYPDKSIDDMFETIENEHDKIDENTEADFHNEKHSYIDMPVREQFYRCVSRYGNRGCSQTEIYRHMSVHNLTLRQMVKQMIAEGLVKNYCVDVGRQRINMYVAIEHADSVNKKAKQTLDVLQNLQCADEPNIPQEDVQYVDIAQIAARIKPYEFKNYKETSSENITQRLLARKAFVVKQIDECCIVSVLMLRKQLVIHEKENGLKDEVCQKSVKRMLYQMSKSNIVRVYEIVLQCEEHIRIYRYVTHPLIDIDHVLLKNEILKLKNSFFLLMEERRLKLLATLRFQASQPKVKMSNKLRAAELKCSKNDMISMKTHKPPKFLISRYLHEFIFYIVVELNECQTALEVDQDLVQHWQVSEPSLRAAEYLEQLPLEEVNIKAYTNNISWRTFIPPLPRYSDKPAGWMYFIDAVDRMPLSIFNKIFRIDKGADERLAAFLNHPIRQHYLMRQLPSDLQYKISRVQLQRVYTSVLKLLNHMGLIQIGERINNKDPLMMWIYLNRRARILDTTHSDAGYTQINSEREYTPLNFDLRSFDDIHHYWTTLQRICVYTKLGFRSRCRGRQERIKELSYLKSVDFDEAPLHDTGYQPGDCLGAAGLSTYLFAHTFRNWSWSIQSGNKLAMKNVRSGRTSGSGTQNTNKVVRVVSRKTRQQVGSTFKRLKKQISETSSKRLKKTSPRDAIDRDALKNMRTLRVAWSRAEDEILMVGKASSTYVAAPIPALGFVTIGKACRDVIRHSLGVYNKTTQACVRRVQFIVRQKRHIPQVPSWLHMLQTNELMQNKYGDNFLQNLKKIYPVRSEYCDALAVHYTLIMCYLYKLIHNANRMPLKSRFILPDSILEFRKRFVERVRVQTDDDSIVYKNPETDFDLQTMIVVNVLHASLSAMRDKTLYNLQAFEIYKNYSEEVLHSAFSRARSDGLAVSLKRKNINLMSNQIAGPAYILSSKYKLKLLFLRVPYGVYDACYAFFENVTKTLFDSIDDSLRTSDSKELIELKSPTLGQMFVISEGLSRNLFEVNFRLPINILTVDAEQSQSGVSSMDRILDHYHSIFDNAPQQEYTKIIENEQNEKQVHVKFHPANLSYKVYYSPYDLISKLPSRYLHFFCALDFMEQEIEINFTKLQRTDEDGYSVIECPFKCIFESQDYITEIARIVEEKKSILNSLTEMAPQKLLNLATSGLSMKVYTSNLLTLVRMLESYWHEKDSQNEKKDLGKYQSTLKMTKPIDWSLLCNDLLMFNANTEDEFDKTEEYEPTLNKEERVIRAQDVFVVNLPTIQLNVNKKQTKNVVTISHKGVLNIPSKILESEVQRGPILEKILKNALWKYTESNFNKLNLNDIGFNAMEQKHLKEIHDFIENHELGVTVTDLMSEFPYEQFLLKALKLLSSEFLIKRVGVASFMYVHKHHIRSWVVHTFNLKRLDRENMGHTMSLKRSYNQINANKDDSNDLNKDQEIRAKRCKTTSDDDFEEATCSSKGRVSKPVKRFESTQKDIGSIYPKQRDIIVMQPVPWIRLNGSVNRRVLDRWLGTILSECIARNGISAQEICKRFPHWLPVDVMFLLEILSDLKCLQLTQIHKQQVDLFSDYESIKETPVPFVYNPESTFIKTSGDATTRLSLFIGKKKYTSELI